MAGLTGTATGLEDLFTRIVNFLTTNATLVGLGQEWEVLRQRRDNLATITTNMVDTGGNIRRLLQVSRYESRSANAFTNNTAAAAYNGTFVAGVSHISYQLRTARVVSIVRIRASPDLSGIANAPRSFRVQSSPDGTTWTTRATVTNTPVFAQSEWRDFAVAGGTSALHWRFLIDASQGSTTIAFRSLLLLESDGTVANQFGSEVYFKATGLAGTDEIYTGMRSEYDLANGWFNLFWNGYTGFDANEQSFFLQPGALPGFGSSNIVCNPMTPLWDASMPFWFAASGRSFRMAVKVSTSYESAYIGFGLPYAQPDQFPYPLVVAGSMGLTLMVNPGAEWRYSAAQAYHGSIAGPGAVSWGTSPPADQYTSMAMRGVDGVWLGISNRPMSTSNAQDTIVRPEQATSFPYAQFGNARGVWPHMQFGVASVTPGDAGRYAYRENLGGGYALVSCVILTRIPVAGPQMELEGVSWISGQGNASENTGTFAGSPYTVFQGAYRNTAHEFFALKMD